MADSERDQFSRSDASGFRALNVRYASHAGSFDILNPSRLPMPEGGVRPRECVPRRSHGNPHIRRIDACIDGYMREFRALRFTDFALSEW